MSLAAPTSRPAVGAAVPYRHDLDGLRGIAIVLVAVFHVWFGRVSGGVDVFLTLSGFFFVSSLLRHVLTAASGATSWSAAVNPWPRLQRLLRRLLPALLIVLGAVWLLTAVVLPRTRWFALTDEIRASALYYQNYELANTAQDYAAASADRSPLQHLWSMSMQGQFFLGALLALLAVGAGLKAAAGRWPVWARPGVVHGVLFGVVGGVAAASLWWAARQHRTDQMWNYYDTLARLWEPLAGGLLAIALSAVALRRTVSGAAPVPRWRGYVAALVSVGALALIVSVGWWIDGVASYPGPLALFPVGATVALIAVGGGANPVSRVLGAKPLVWLGGVAYALYLWHWPLLIFYLHHQDQAKASPESGAAILAVSLLLAWGTQRFVEVPLRRGVNIPALVVVVVVTSVTAATGVGWQRHVNNLSIPTHLDEARYPGARALYADVDSPGGVSVAPNPLIARKDIPPVTATKKMAQFDGSNVVEGVFGDPAGDRTIAVIGGSHSEFWVGALDVIGKRENIKVVTYLKAACPLSVTRVTTWQGEIVPCRTWTRKVLERVAQTDPDWVFTASTRAGVPGQRDRIPLDYFTVFDQLRDMGVPVIGLRDTPWTFGVETPADCLVAGGSAHDCGVSRRQLPAVAPTARWEGRWPNMSFLDMTAAICEPRWCPAVVGNVLVWRDEHHLTNSFVLTTTDELARQLHTVPGWQS